LSNRPSTPRESARPGPRRKSGSSWPRRPLTGSTPQALAAKLAAIAAFIGLTIAVAVKAAWWWTFLVILAVAGFGYLLGLSNYGVAEEDPADDANDGHQVRSPVSH